MNFAVESSSLFHICIRLIFIPGNTIVAGYCGFTLDVRVSARPSVVRPSVFRFWMITSKHQWIFTKLGMWLELWRSGLGLLMGKFRQILTVICLRHAHIFTWVNINECSANLVYALILWKSGLGLLMCKFRQILTELSAWDTPAPYFRFWTITWVNVKRF